MLHTLRPFLLTLLLVLCSAEASAAFEHLLPRPQQITPTAGTFTGSIDDAIVAIDAAAVKTFDYKVAGFENEGYSLSITPQGITITAASSIGVIRAKQTLRQIIASECPANSQAISPRF